MDTMIELPALRRSAELAPNTVDADARTVEVIWSAGARVRRASFFGEPYDEELSLDPAHVRLDRLNAGAPFLKVHELDTLDAVIGSVVPGSARIENGRGIALVRISERADVEPIWRDIQAGHIRAVSIGYQVHRFEVSKPEAARELWRAVDWTPFEVSAVAVGADPAAVAYEALEKARTDGAEILLIEVNGYHAVDLIRAALGVDLNVRRLNIPRQHRSWSITLYRGLAGGRDRRTTVRPRRDHPDPELVKDVG